MKKILTTTFVIFMCTTISMGAQMGTQGETGKKAAGRGTIFKSIAPKAGPNSAPENYDASLKRDSLPRPATIDDNFMDKFWDDPVKYYQKLTKTYEKFSNSLQQLYRSKPAINKIITESKLKSPEEEINAQIQDTADAIASAFADFYKQIRQDRVTLKPLSASAIEKMAMSENPTPLGKAFKKLLSTAASARIGILRTLSSQYDLMMSDIMAAESNILFPKSGASPAKKTQYFMARYIVEYTELNNALSIENPGPTRTSFFDYVKKKYIDPDAVWISPKKKEGASAVSVKLGQHNGVRTPAAAPEFNAPPPTRPAPSRPAPKRPTHTPTAAADRPQN